MNKNYYPQFPYSVEIIKYILVKLKLKASCVNSTQIHTAFGEDLEVSRIRKLSPVLLGFGRLIKRGYL